MSDWVANNCNPKVISIYNPRVTSICNFLSCKYYYFFMVYIVMMNNYYRTDRVPNADIRINAV